MLRLLRRTSTSTLCRSKTVSAYSTKVSIKENLVNNEGISGDFRVGSSYHGFLCTRIEKIKEFNMTALIFNHEKTGTPYLHLSRDDMNNVFSINFRTTPFNSTGLPHILEHTVLCGSQKFPVRDPFFKMINRSLATFMNAMTGPDYTFYPFSSQNDADYRNLQSVYMDAVLRPNLDKFDFLQEGWRLENSDLKDKKSELAFKGVVFNEMKGAFSENGSVFGQKFLNTILPDHTYGYISGGDPLEIPNLTLKDLKEFHQRYYHPSNARIYSYGNFPLEKNLKFCNEEYLQNYEGIDPKYSLVPPQKRWNSPAEHQITGRFDKMGAPIEKQNQIAIGYLMCDITDVYETFLLQLLGELMVLGPNSPFYKSLIEPNISGGYSGMTGFDSQMRDTMFLIGLQDLEIDTFDKVKTIIDQTVDRIIEQGFEKSHINSVLHQIELAIKHQSARFGMSTLFNLTALWNHDGPLIEAMQVGSLLQKFKNNLNNPRYLQDRVEYYFKKNNHKLTLTMVPDEKYEEKLSKEEEKLLKEKISKLNEEDKDRIYKEALKLSESQKAKQATDILPCLSLQDIPKEVPKVNLSLINFDSIPYHICEANTNDVTYFRGILNTSDLPMKSKLLLPLFNETVFKMDMNNFSFREFHHKIKMTTGGLSISSLVAEKLDDPFKFEEGVMFSSHSLDYNVDGMLSIWLEVFGKPLYKDEQRFKMLLDNYMSGLTNGIADMGHVYAMRCASALVTPSAELKEAISGIKHIEYMKDLIKNQSTAQIMKEVDNISIQLLKADRLRCSINLSKTNKEEILSEFEMFTNKIVKNRHKSDAIIFSKGEANKNDSVPCIHNVMNIPINFCSKSILTVPVTHPDYAKLCVLSKFLNAKYLHPVVREQNGAYGGGSKLSNDGLFTFYSYRDPNNRVTLDVFDNTANWMSTTDTLDDQALFEAKIGIFQQLDAPVPEFAKGLDSFTHGVTRELKQKNRAEVLAVSKEDLRKVCDKYLSNDTNPNLVGKCVIGPESESSLEKSGEKWTVFKPSS